VKRNLKQIISSDPISVFVTAFLLFGVCAFSGIFLSRALNEAAIFWPANAAIVWLGLYIGYRYLPALLSGVLLSNALMQIVFGDPAAVAVGLPLANAVGITTLLLTLRFFGLGLRSIGDTGKALLFFGVICIAPLPAALIGAETLQLAFSAPLATTALHWWAGDVVSSIIILLPLLSAPRIARVSTPSATRRRVAAFEILAGVVLSAAGFIVLNAFGLPYSAGIIIPLLWVALREGVFLTALAGSIFIIFASVLLAFDLMHAANAELPLEEAIFELQIMSLLSILPAYFIAASINARNVAYINLAAKEKLAVQKAAELEVTLANMNQGMSCFDKDHRLTVWNRQYAEMFEMDLEKVSTGMAFLDILETQKRNGNFEGDPRDLLSKILEKTGAGESHRSETKLASGRIIFSVHTANPNGGWIATHADVTEKRNIEQSIAHDAMHDALTGLPNRRYHEQELTERAAKCQEEGGGVALLHVDLDRFKNINDTLGHDAGDAMLVHAAQVLKSIVRQTDFVARVGGDEFVVICDIKNNTEFLSAVADRIIAKMQEPVPYKGQLCRFGVSIGIALQKGKKVDGKQLLINADIALYRAKSNGRGCYEHFTTELHTEVMTHKQLSDEILVGIERGEFIVHYQPQINARTNKIFGVEALVRWQHPKRGLLGPDKFIDIAEDIDQVAEIDRIVLSQTLRDMADWKKRGVKVPHASVNVSARRLSDPNLLENLKSLKIPRGTISFELRESIYLDDEDDSVMWSIDQIKELGIDIELDDFGTGHTSIVSLHSVKPNKLKIDRRLIIPIIDDPSQLQIIKSVIDIAKALGIETIAEGVETMEHTRVLMEAGCKMMQGFGYAGPMNAEDLEAYINSEKWKAA
jgi:diguanylate cyclase (GGDEF)-like protein